MEEFKSNITKLQNLVKRDPHSYLTDFELHFNRFKTLYDLQIRTLESHNHEFVIIVSFLGAVINNYPQHQGEYIKMLYDLVKQHGTDLECKTRHQICAVLFKMRKFNIISLTDFIEVIVNLFDCPDKNLRTDLFKILLKDIKTGFRKSHFDQSSRNKIINSFYVKIVDNCTKNVQVACLCILLEMWRRNIWRDEKTANHISQGVFSPHIKVSYMALLALKGEMQKISELPDDDDEDLAQAQDYVSKESKRMKVHKNSRNAKKYARKLKSTAKRIAKASNKPDDQQQDNSLIRFLYSPQIFCDKIFGLVKKTKRLEYRILVLEVLSRVAFYHELVVPSVFDYSLNYLRPHQTGVIKIMNCVAQASHKLIPAEFIRPVVETICHHFVSLQNPPEICSVGINSVREIYSRAPQAVDAIIANDLVQYCHDRKAERSVMTAARSLLQLLRAINPEILAKKYQISKPRTNTSNSINIEDDSGSNCSEASDTEKKFDFPVLDHDICMNEILDDEDFEKLKSKSSKSMAEITNYEDIATVYNLKKNKNQKNSENKEHYNPHKNWRFNPKSSSTNTEKKKNKPYNMAKNRYEVKKKKSRSFKERASALKKALLRKKKSRC